MALFSGMTFYSWCNCFPAGASQQTFTCSKSAIETLEKNVKYVQS